MALEQVSGGRRCFKMNRSSPPAFALKSIISTKLDELLGEYSDDVLAEYIVVMVCNGKHQNDAKIDLEDFLGENTGHFVSWLWDHLHTLFNQSQNNNVIDAQLVAQTSPSPRPRLRSLTRRGNVWDRLGKPCREKEERSVLYRRSIGEALLSGKTKRKRHFGEIDPGSYFVRERFRTKKLGDLDHVFECPRVALNTIVDNMSQTESIIKVSENANLNSLPVSVTLVTKSEDTNIEDSVDTKLVQANILDMKLRLHKMDMEMSKLRPLVESTNDGKTNSSSSSGAMSSQVEDIESRTVFVTNVHFAATKGNLAKHFSKCGAIVNVIILNDVVTAQPKGSAYITFADKEFADKAIALTGTSFWSRILKVVRKTEMSVVTPVLAQPSWKPWHLINKNAIFQKPYFSTHLQWRRDQQSNSEDSTISSPRRESDQSVSFPVGSKANLFEEYRQSVDADQSLPLPPEGCNTNSPSYTLTDLVA
ncbi:hypothetical protein GIB67_009852 [Kingdonia uniflora]|uniref:RRM domain-containing protein n=1 Tax=Kingdonia uniflora TaxID=39325 RepID=A0A7J7LMH9_9MAGN|nr:hypothetical protein GIB67_009852 [Kingdonia uniflora]